MKSTKTLVLIKEIVKVQLFSHCIDMDKNHSTMTIFNSAGYQKKLKRFLKYINCISHPMELPIEIQNIIHEYAKPVTRPDWKTLHKLPLHRYLGIVSSSYNGGCPVVLCGLERKIRKIWYSDLYE